LEPDTAPAALDLTSENELSPAGLGDLARERRVKALALTAPLHELEQNKALRGWQAFDCYDLSRRLTPSSTRRASTPGSGGPTLTSR